MTTFWTIVVAFCVPVLAALVAQLWGQGSDAPVLWEPNHTPARLLPRTEVSPHVDDLGLGRLTAPDAPPRRHPLRHLPGSLFVEGRRVGQASTTGNPPTRSRRRGRAEPPAAPPAPPPTDTSTTSRSPRPSDKDRPRAHN